MMITPSSRKYVQCVKPHVDCTVGKVYLVEFPFYCDRIEYSVIVKDNGRTAMVNVPEFIPFAMEMEVNEE